jgi:hypothetical protein
VADETDKRDIGDEPTRVERDGCAFSFPSLSLPFPFPSPSFCLLPGHTSSFQLRPSTDPLLFSDSLSHTLPLSLGIPTIVLKVKDEQAAGAAAGFDDKGESKKRKPTGLAWSTIWRIGQERWMEMGM